MLKCCTPRILLHRTVEIMVESHTIAAFISPPAGINYFRERRGTHSITWSTLKRYIMAVLNRQGQLESKRVRVREAFDKKNIDSEYDEKAKRAYRAIRCLI